MPEPLISVGVVVEGAEQLTPEMIERQWERFETELAQAFADMLAEHLPRGPEAGGHVADDVFGYVEEGQVVFGTVGSKYARAIEEGAKIYARKDRSSRSNPNRRGVLRFMLDGKVFFRRSVLIPRNRPGGKPFHRARREQNQVAQRVFDRVFFEEPLE